MPLETMRLFFALLTLGADLAVIGGVALIVGSRFSPALADMRQQVAESIRGRELQLGFVVAATAMLGSLYFSEVAHFEPCKFCWYQRIAMYPIAVLLGIAMWRRDRGVRLYATTLAAIGASISVYHYTIQRYPQLSSGECSAGVPCTAAYFWELGFISIPWMAMSAFALIIVLMTFLRGNERSEQQTDSEFEVSR